MGDDPSPSVGPQHQPGRYSLWMFERDDKAPILVAAYEWEIAGLRSVRPECVWLHQEDTEADWENHPEFDKLTDGAEAAIFASLIAQGKLHRIGTLPAIERYAEPPTCLRSPLGLGAGGCSPASSRRG